MKAGLVGVVAVFAAGCFIKPDAPEPAAGGTDAGGDGSVRPTDGGTTGGCTLKDDFNAGATDCGPWATLYKVGASVSLAHGPATLSITAGAGGGYARCTSVQHIDILNGVTVQILSVPPESTTVVKFEVVDNASLTHVGLRITGHGVGVSPTAEIQHTDNTVSGTRAFQADMMKLWRLRREDNVLAAPAISSRDVVLEYLDAGGTWNELGRAGVPLTSFTSTQVHLFATFAAASTMPAVFENLDGCQ